MKVAIDNGHGVGSRNQSPDGALVEYIWAREMAALVVYKLKNKAVDATLLVPEMENISLKQRVARVNTLCSLYGSNNVLLFSIHNNALGAGSWNEANGFSTFVSKNASKSSKRMADIVYRKTKDAGLVGNRAVHEDADGLVYWMWTWRPEDIYILHESKCPAVLAECMFMTNKKDVEYLLSDEGKEQIADIIVDSIVEYIESK